MNKHTYYTAIGSFKRKVNGQGQSCPVIIINQQEYGVDIQEMALWTALNWRLLDFQQIRTEYDKLDRNCAIPALRTLEDCLGRLCTRGLVASGSGETILRRFMICLAVCMWSHCPRACPCGWPFS